MKTPKLKVSLEATFSIELNEQEIGALDAIFGYSVESFLKGFRKELGAGYVDKYEAGVRSLHDRIRSMTAPALSEIRRTRQALNDTLKNA